jgi:hypothetical protein
LKNPILALGILRFQNIVDVVVGNWSKPAKTSKPALSATGSNPIANEHSGYSGNGREEMNAWDYPISDWLRELRLEKIEKLLGKHPESNLIKQKEKYE